MVLRLGKSGFHIGRSSTAPLRVIGVFNYDAAQVYIEFNVPVVARTGIAWFFQVSPDGDEWFPLTIYNEDGVQIGGTHSAGTVVTMWMVNGFVPYILGPGGSYLLPSQSGEVL